MALAVSAFSGCSSETESTTTNVAAIATSDLTVTVASPSVTVAYANMSGASTDWITLAKTTDDDQTYEAWMYTGGGASGQVVFASPGLADGTYEARAYYDWEGTQSYTVQKRSAPFQIGSTPAPLQADASTYTANAPITITYTNLGSTNSDWIALYTVGASDQSYLDYRYTDGSASGSVTFNNGLPAGTYEARFHTDWNGTQSYTSTATSPQFTVSNASSLTPSQASYTSVQNVTINYSGMPGNAHDWIAVAPAGSPATTYGQWFYLNGATSGSQVFDPLPGGNYEARVYLNDSFTIVATAAFSVTGSMISTDMTTYTVGATVNVNYSGMPGNNLDWVAVATAGSPDTSYVAWTYTNGQTSGTFAVPNLPAGNYEARAYLDNSSTVLSRSTFTVVAQSTPAISTDASSYGTGQTVTVTYSGLPGNSTDWIAISTAGSPSTSYVTYVYTGGQQSGTATFSNLPAGSYEARAYVNDSYTIDATSSTFTVTGGATASVSTDMATYASGSPVTVTYSNLPGNDLDWVAVAMAGSPDSSFVSYVYTHGATSGMTTFNGLAAGNYEARAYVNDSYTVLSRSTFTISP